MNTRSVFGGRPSLGAWVSYGLGTENKNLPAFVVIKDSEGTVVNGVRNWGTGFMPAVYQGVEFTSDGVPIKYLDNPKGVTTERQREKLDLLGRIQPAVRRYAHRQHRARSPHSRLRTRLPHASRGATGRRPQQRNPTRRSNFTAWTTRRPPSSAATACSPVGSWKMACASCNSTAAQQQMGQPQEYRAAPLEALPLGRPAHRGPAQRLERRAACSMRRWSSGEANLAAPR